MAFQVTIRVQMCYIRASLSPLLALKPRRMLWGGCCHLATRGTRQWSTSSRGRSLRQGGLQVLAAWWAPEKVASEASSVLWPIHSHLPHLPNPLSLPYYSLSWFSVTFSVMVFSSKNSYLIGHLIPQILFSSAIPHLSLFSLGDSVDLTF